MSTALRIEPPEHRRLGPQDHGRELTCEQFLAAECEEGYKYELIDGRLEVSPEADLPHYIHEHNVYHLLHAYSVLHPDIIGFVAGKSRIFAKQRRKTTIPQPDVTAFRERVQDFDLRWEDLTPVIVVEVLLDNWQKDLVRNVELYNQIPSVLEYWVLDLRADIRRPTLKVFRRDAGDQDWTTADYPAEAVYTTLLLPGFELPVTPKW